MFIFLSWINTLFWTQEKYIYINTLLKFKYNQTNNEWPAFNAYLIFFYYYYF